MVGIGFRIVALVALAALAAAPARPRPLAAQDAPGGPPDPALIALLPPPAAFGDGWVRVGEPTRLVPDPAFRDGALAAYGGPAGSRVALTALLVTDDRVAIRAAWEEATTLYDRHRTDLAYEEADADALAVLPPPPGCAEAKRIEGPSERDTFPTGVTLCAAADPDLILLAVASGDVAGESGARAADAVIAAAFAAPPAATASPSVAP